LKQKLKLCGAHPNIASTNPKPFQGLKPDRPSGGGKWDKASTNPKPFQRTLDHATAKLNLCFIRLMLKRLAHG